MIRYLSVSEQRRACAEEERRRLHRLVHQQSMALTACTQHMQQLRVAHAQKVGKVNVVTFHDMYVWGLQAAHKLRVAYASLQLMADRLCVQQHRLWSSKSNANATAC